MSGLQMNGKGIRISSIVRKFQYDGLMRENGWTVLCVVWEWCAMPREDEVQYTFAAG